MQIEAALSTYRRMAMLPPPTGLNVQSAANWMNNNKPLIRSEATFLHQPDDLVALAVNDDHGAADEVLEWLMARCLPQRLTTLVSYN
jgi:hypothetical protein